MSDEIYINVNEESNDIIVQVAEFDQVISVNGETGNVIVDKNTIGLSNVENISIVATSGHLQNQIFQTGLNLQSQINNLYGSGFITSENVVYTTGNQTISGAKTFDVRPTVNGTGVLLSGEASTSNLLFYSQPSGYLTGINITGAITGTNTGIGDGGIFLGSTHLSQNNTRFVDSSFIKKYKNGPVGIYSTIASSSNGQYIYTTLSFGPNNLRISRDYGKTWVDSVINFSNIFASISCSSDGKYILIADGDNRIATSNDYGFSWKINNTLTGYSSSVSSDGKYQIVGGDNLYVSNNYGQTWTLKLGLPSAAYSSSISDDGKYQIVGIYISNSIYLSKDYGVTWQEVLIDYSFGVYWVTISGDGKHISVAGTWGIWISNDYGVTWKQTFSYNFTEVLTMSKNGKYQVGTMPGLNPPILVYSTDYGNNWSYAENVLAGSNNTYYFVHLNSNGKYLYVSSYTSNYPLKIFTLDEEIDGVMNFTSAPTVNGTGVLLSGEAIPSSTANYITVEVNNNPVTNGTNLLAAYAKAKTTLPNGSALSATNRLAIILPPAIYDLGTQSLTLDTQYIDIIGSTPDRSKHYIKSDVGITNRGTIQQTANNVKLYNLTIENVNSTYIKNYASSDPAAYFPSSNLNNTYFENINLIGNINVWSMRLSIEYSGTFKNCTGGDYAFGAAGGASGTFENCTGGAYSFGGNGTASGTFENCTGGARAFGSFGTASGTFENCTGGLLAFGGSGTASGTFKNCTGGLLAFSSTGAASGTFENCTGGDYSFGYNGTASGTFENCTGGDYAFGGNGTASGTFENCTGGNYSFGGDSGTASGTFKNCICGDYAFGINASGTFENCIGGDFAFGYNTSGIFKNCIGEDGAFGGFGAASGTFENCTGEDYAFGGSGIASGTFKDCTGGIGSFGGDLGTASGTFKDCSGGEFTFGYDATGTFENCTSGNYAFGYNASGTFKDCTGGDSVFGANGTASGTFKNCTGGYGAFGGDSGTANGTFKDCTGGEIAFGGNGTANGTFKDCIGGNGSFNL